MPKAQVVRADPPGMEEQDNASSAFMVDEWDRPMTCVELLRMMKEKPATKCAIHTYMIPIPMERRRRSKETEVGGYEGTTVQQYSSNIYFTYTYQVSIKIY